MKEVRPRVAARYDLVAMKKAIETPGFRIGENVRKACRESLGGDRSGPELDTQILAILREVSPDDYAHPFDLTFGPRRARGDVYAPVDEHGRLWYVKLAVIEGRTRVYSCHLAYEDVELFNGTVRRRCGDE